MSLLKRRACLSIDLKKKILQEVDENILRKTEIAKKIWNSEKQPFNDFKGR